MTIAATDLNAARRKHNADAALLVLFNAARRSVEAGADPGEAIRRHVAAAQGPVAGRLRLTVTECAAKLIAELNEADGIPARGGVVDFG